MREVWFDERVAAGYDEDSREMFAPAVLDPAVDLLAELAAGGPVLEFAVGTGRMALPLARRGLRVSGIDVSEPMLARLRAKPGAAAVAASVGDFTTTRVPGRFSLVYLVFNTIMNVTSQQEQVATFRNAAAHLAPGGRFAVEVGVPALQRLPPGERVRAFALTPEHLGFDEYDVVTQIVRSHHYRLADGRAELFSAPFRYVWPAELDLMAQLAGLEPEHRWADWARSPFGADSTAHVSVWRKP
ncbi:class I SAM-dependent DNA methyltransferase [Geodermatophilus sp. SYSU D00691]